MSLTFALAPAKVLGVTLDFPLWAVGLAIAGLAPFLVGFIVNAIDSLARKRTQRAFASSHNDEERQSVSRRTS